MPPIWMSSRIQDYFTQGTLDGVGAQGIPGQQGPVEAASLAVSSRRSDLPLGLSCCYGLVVSSDVA